MLCCSYYLKAGVACDLFSSFCKGRKLGIKFGSLNAGCLPDLRLGDEGDLAP